MHRLIFLCNSREEVALVHGIGEAAIFHNKTTNVTENLFTPLAHVEREFDAIYNAHLGPWKRHELTLDIDHCGFMFYRAGSSTTESEAALIARHAKLAPGHVFINEIGEDGRPVRLPPEQVNYHLNQAAIGLCLSELEGAMFACAEYLLAGLPVITTPNQGGRDFYLHDEFCITVPADRRAIAESVAALKARKIPRDYVREQTLKRIQPHRRRFVELIDSILAETNAPKRSIGIWPSSPPPVIMRWFRSPQAYNQIRNPAPDAFGQALMGSGDNGKSSAFAAAGKFVKRRIPAFGKRS
ncbi:MAG: hypothetical protein C0605_02010 [Hyphomicrobiales bacterium]|nr:MAG: hypothetical protein C0605_02010 [Hyphomicrobiales bacterium]